MVKRIVWKNIKTQIVTKKTKENEFVTNTKLSIRGHSLTSGMSL